jgi:Dyp-type peroxidase family
MQSIDAQPLDSAPAAPHSATEQPASESRRRSPPGPRALLELPTTATRQFDSCVLVPIVGTRRRELSELLEHLREQTIAVMKGQPVPVPLLEWEGIAGLHYARFVIIDAQEQFGTPAQLALSTCYDGPLGDAHCSHAEAQGAHLRELVRVARNLLDSVFRCCEGYAGLNGLEQYLSEHLVSAATFYVGSTGRCRDQVLAEALLRARVQELVDRLYEHSAALSAEQVRQQVRELILEELAAGEQPDSGPRATRRELPGFPAQPDRRIFVVLAGGAAVALGLGSVLALFSGVPPLQLASAALLGGLLLAALRLRQKEQTDRVFVPAFSESERAHSARVSEDEDLFLQNELTHLVDLKPGWLRSQLSRAVLLGVGFLARNLYNKGKLGSIPSIHFARWARIDRGRRVLFFSNFDGSWQSYLGDFIDQASSGLTAIWSNTVGYPRTRWLACAGSKDASRFKAWVRHQQIRTQVWYAAYPHLSIRNVNANTEIRRGLAEPGVMSAQVWLDWLQGVDRVSADRLHRHERARSSLRPAAAPSPAAEKVPLADVQGLVLRGYGPKKGAEYLLLRVEPQQAASARAWLSELDLTSADTAHTHKHAARTFVNVAFTHRGLAALGMDRALLDDFPLAFVQGADHPARCRVNGDVGDNAPQSWDWGAGDNGVDVLLMLYAPSPEEASRAAREHRARAEAAGLRFVLGLNAGELPGRKEHFGFRDGIAQPVVRGTRASEPAYNTLPPGEFLLGHTDAYGNIAHAPGAGAVSPFGQNGSYLVFRQLEQNVESFWRYCAREAGRLHTDAVTVAAKMVGRWPSGASLVKHPDRDPQQDRYQNEDDFAYLATHRHNDRGGSACPFGAHVRRTNPRDWELGSSRHESLELANRHRLIRRGRPYGASVSKQMDVRELAGSETAPESPRGLQFLAFNADLERQFEFVQQQWLQNPAFADLAANPDAIAGTSSPRAVDPPAFTIQQDTARSSFGRCVGLDAFVRLRGAGYFFMPSVSAVRRLKLRP